MLLVADIEMIAAISGGYAEGDLKIKMRNARGVRSIRSGAMILIFKSVAIHVLRPVSVLEGLWWTIYWSILPRKSACHMHLAAQHWIEIRAKPPPSEPKFPCAGYLQLIADSPALDPQSAAQEPGRMLQP